MADIRSLADLGQVLRALRRRHARANGGAALTYRELAAATGWSHGIVGEYLSGRVLPPTDRFDVLIRLLGATPSEQGALATARDRIEEARRRPHSDGAVPRQLPIDVYAFTGRRSHLDELTALLAEGDRRSAVVISAVAGTAGVGKTALAVRWAHQVADRFPDGHLYVDLRGYGPERPLSPADALAGFLRSLGVDGTQIPADLAERSARFRTAVADRRLLMVLDNASGADQVRPLLPGTPGCFVVVTSRDRLSGLVVRDGAYRIDLDVLTAAEAVALLRSLVGARVDAEPVAAGELAECCARLPLAVRIAGTLSPTHSLSLADLVAQLRDRRLDTLEVAGDPRTAVRSVFSWSYHHLTPASARIFALLALHPGPDIDGYAVAALASADPPVARAALDELARAHLIQPSSGDFFGLHDLLRAYALELAGELYTMDEQRAAQARLLDYFRSTASAAVRALYPHDPPPPADGPQVDEPGCWLDRQRPNLVAVALYAATHGWPRHSVDLSLTLWRYFEVGGHYQEALAVHTKAAEVAPGSAGVLANLGGIHWWLGNHEEARDCLERSLTGHRAGADLLGEARAAARLGLVYERLGRYAGAAEQMRQALAIHRRTGDQHGEAGQLLNLGTVHRRLGNLVDAAEHHRQAAQLFASLGERRLQGYALGNLGAVRSLLGQHAEALDDLHRALAYCRETGDRGGEASALATIGAVHSRQSNWAAALEHLKRALALSRETGDRSLETETLNTLGETHLATGRAAQAVADHRAALAITERTGDLFEYARALDGLGCALHATGDWTQAISQWSEALAVYRRLGVPEAERVRARLPLSTAGR